MSYKNILIISYLSIFLVSCSTFDGLRFWQKDEVDPEEPRELLSFNDQKSLEVQWNLSFDGVNEFGSFEPGFSSNALFFADAEGNVVSVKISSAEENWRKELDFLSSGVAAGFGVAIVADINGNVIALSQDDGSEIWSTNVKGEVLSKVAIDPKTIVVTGFHANHFSQSVY